MRYYSRKGIFLIILTQGFLWVTKVYLAERGYQPFFEATFFTIPPYSSHIQFLMRMSLFRIPVTLLMKHPGRPTYFGRCHISHQEHTPTSFVKHQINSGGQNQELEELKKRG